MQHDGIQIALYHTFTLLTQAPITLLCSEYQWHISGLEPTNGNVVAVDIGASTNGLRDQPM